MVKEKRFKKVMFKDSKGLVISVILGADDREKIRKLQRLSKERGFVAEVTPCDKLGKEVPKLLPTVKKKVEPAPEKVPG